MFINKNIKLAMQNDNLYNTTFIPNFATQIFFLHSTLLRATTVELTTNTVCLIASASSSYSSINYDLH